MERSVYGSGHLSMASGIGRATEHEVMRSITEGEGSESHDGGGQQHFLVAMRLRDTPVLIPNTMVKT